ncbi:ABC transporter ATP-binding protein, partial [Rhodoferax sp. 4810]|nr:ABC transporter ATP-binding protein [Rhodoferax jenense]
MFLEIDHLNLWFNSYNEKNQPVQNQVLFDVSLDFEKGETVALVGESGSGKSITALSILRLLEDSCNITQNGEIRFQGQNVFALSSEEIRSIRGNKIAMIFQEPMTSLNPVYTIGNQLMEPLRLHRKMTQKEAEQEAIRLLGRTGIDDPAGRLGSYSHQLSGGQRQRVMIAMALACRPVLLIADEPTTALDVTIQAQILDLIKDIQAEYGMGLLLITHDLEMVRKQASRIYIMQKGRIVE